MSKLLRVLGGLVQTVVTFVVLILLSIAAFYVTVFVVSTGGLAGYDPSGDFVVLAAALLVVAALLGGVPFRGLTEAPEEDNARDPTTGFE